MQGPAPGSHAAARTCLAGTCPASTRLARAAAGGQCTSLPGPAGQGARACEERQHHRAGGGRILVHQRARTVSVWACVGVPGSDPGVTGNSVHRQAQTATRSHTSHMRTRMAWRQGSSSCLSAACWHQKLPGGVCLFPHTLPFGASSHGGGTDLAECLLCPMAARPMMTAPWAFC